MGGSKLSVIIPMLNEAAALPDFFEMWRRLAEDGCEVIVVDGGSTDHSVSLTEQADRRFRVLRSARGRARQMNAGAAVATGGILLFLHADTILPVDAARIVREHLERSPRVWGRFAVCIEGRSLWFPVIARMMNLRSRWTGIATGDQAIFVRREAFEQLGGFPDQLLMEDIEISKRLLGLSRPLTLRHRVKTSGRRWESRGVWTTILLMWRLRWAYWRGASAEDIAREYT